MPVLESDVAAADPEIFLTRFHRLMKEIQNGQTVRNSFQPWEIEILLDVHECKMSKGRRRTLLDRYERAVRRQVERGARVPMKLSEYLRRGSDRAATVAGKLS